MNETIRRPTPEEIIRARMLLGVSQTAFGRALGRSLRQVQRLEAGETPGTAELALALVALLRGTAADDLGQELTLRDQLAAATD